MFVCIHTNGIWILKNSLNIITDVLKRFIIILVAAKP